MRQTWWESVLFNMTNQRLAARHVVTRVYFLLKYEVLWCSI